MLDHCITEEMLADVLQQFMQELQEVHTTTEKKIWEKLYSAVQGYSAYYGNTVLVRLGPKSGKIENDEEVYGKIYTH